MIRDQRMFKSDGTFYKGNIHCHSTDSDGRLTRAVLKDIYKQAGYDFISYTDHMKYIDSKELEDNDFIALPGFEWDISQLIGGGYASKTHHVLGIRGTEAMVNAAKEKPIQEGETIPRFTYDGAKTVRDMRDYLADRGFIAIYNHPSWSHVNPEDFGDLNGYMAFEAYNHGCETESATGTADLYWEYMLEKGIRIGAVATDDNHNRISDNFGGFIMVKAHTLSRESLLESMLEGHYYASNGPMVYDAYIKDGKAYVECSPCSSVILRAGGFVCGCAKVSGHGITRASFDVPDRALYVRIECVDAAGGKAWLNPFWTE